jgi:hypothetical protein
VQERRRRIRLRLLLSDLQREPSVNSEAVRRVWRKIRHGPTMHARLSRLHQQEPSQCHPYAHPRAMQIACLAPKYPGICFTEVEKANESGSRVECVKRPAPCCALGVGKGHSSIPECSSARMRVQHLSVRFVFALPRSLFRRVKYLHCQVGRNGDRI